MHFSWARARDFVRWGQFPTGYQYNILFQWNNAYYLSFWRRKNAKVAIICPYVWLKFKHEWRKYIDPWNTDLEISACHPFLITILEYKEVRIECEILESAFSTHKKVQWYFWHWKRHFFMCSIRRGVFFYIKDCSDFPKKKILKKKFAFVSNIIEIVWWNYYGY